MRKQTITCSDLFKHICTNLEEAFDSAECKKLKLHFDDCPDCKTNLRSIQSTIKMYRSYPVPSISKKKLKKLERLVLAKK